MEETDDDGSSSSSDTEEKKKKSKHSKKAKKKEKHRRKKEAKRSSKKSGEDENSFEKNTSDISVRDTNVNVDNDEVQNVLESKTNRSSLNDDERSSRYEIFLIIYEN